MKLQEFALEALDVAHQSCDSALDKLQADMTGTMARQTQLIQSLERNRVGVVAEQVAEAAGLGRLLWALTSSVLDSIGLEGLFLDQTRLIGPHHWQDMARSVAQEPVCFSMGCNQHFEM